jgi:hypothetical protein
MLDFEFWMMNEELGGDFEQKLTKGGEERRGTEGARILATD